MPGHRLRLSAPRIRTGACRARPTGSSKPNVVHQRARGLLHGRPQTLRHPGHAPLHLSHSALGTARQWRASPRHAASTAAAESNIPTNNVTDFDKQERLSFQVDDTWYVTSAGQHTIKGGFQVDRLAQRRELVRDGPYVAGSTGDQTYRGQSRAPTATTAFRSNCTTATKPASSRPANVATNNYGLFIQDAWSVSSRLTVNLGLRTETETVPCRIDGTLPGDAGCRRSSSASPTSWRRALGFAYDIKGDGKWKAYGSWGIFYDIFKMNLGARVVRRREVGRGRTGTRSTRRLRRRCVDDASCTPNCPARWPTPACSDD